MSDFPHGHPDHSGWGCSKPDCQARIQLKYDTVNAMLEEANVIEGESSTSYTNMETGQWLQTKDGSLISIARAREMNRAQRRREGIRL
jgi:hypothetical protein